MTRRLLRTVVIWAATLGCTFSTNAEELNIEKMLKQSLKMETISATNFRAIQAALPELERRSLNINDYKIVIVEFPESPESIIVMFRDPDVPMTNTVYGSPGKRPDIEVEVSKENFRVIKAHFMR